MTERSGGLGWTWPEQARRGALAGVVAVTATAITWYLAVALLTDADPALMVLAYAAMAAAAGAGLLAAWVTARTARLVRPGPVVVAGSAVTVLMIRMGVVGLDVPADTALIWAVSVACAAVAFAVAAVLAGPHRSRRWWAARALAAAVALATVPLAPVVAHGREAGDREARFEALDVPLVTVELAGYRVTHATVRPDLPDRPPENLELVLSPAGGERDWRRRITVSVHRAAGRTDCAVLTGTPERYGTWGQSCRAVDSRLMVLGTGRDAGVAIVEEGAVATLSVTRGSDLTSADLLPARLRPASAGELATLD